MKPLIFLVGCSRSGTTVLQSLLATHPDIATFPETKFFHYLFPPRREIIRYFLRLNSTKIKPRMETFFEEELKRPEFLEGLPNITLTRFYIKKVIGILEALADEEGKNFILEKTPDHIYCLEKIENYLPQSQFIHILRNGTDVVASLYEVTHQYPQAWGGARSIDRCIINWIDAIQKSQKYSDQPNHFLVRYESLISNPENIMKKICTFLKIDFYESMIQNYSMIAKKVSLVEEGRGVNYEGIMQYKSHKFTKIFTLEEQKYIIDRLSIIDIDKIFI